MKKQHIRVAAGLTLSALFLSMSSGIAGWALRAEGGGATAPYSAEQIASLAKNLASQIGNDCGYLDKALAGANKQLEGPFYANGPTTFDVRNSIAVFTKAKQDIGCGSQSGQSASAAIAERALQAMPGNTGMVPMQQGGRAYPQDIMPKPAAMPMGAVPGIGTDMGAGMEQEDIGVTRLEAENQDLSRQVEDMRMIIEELKGLVVQDKPVQEEQESQTVAVLRQELAAAREEKQQMQRVMSEMQETLRTMSAQMEEMRAAQHAAAPDEPQAPEKEGLVQRFFRWIGF